jgi:hypothetical protein
MCCNARELSPQVARSAWMMLDPIGGLARERAATPDLREPDSPGDRRAARDRPWCAEVGHGAPIDPGPTRQPQELRRRRFRPFLQTIQHLLPQPPSYFPFPGSVAQRPTRQAKPRGGPTIQPPPTPPPPSVNLLRPMRPLSLLSSALHPPAAAAAAAVAAAADDAADRAGPPA